jgi:chromosome partitioning protein
VIVVSVCSLKGGVGKTSVVLGLASAAQARGLATLVVDLDPQADATLALDVPPLEPEAEQSQATVSAVLGTGRRPSARDGFAPSGWTVPGGSPLDVLLGSPEVADLERPGSSPRAVERLSRRLRSTVDEVQHDYRLVLLDCPPSLGAITLAGLSSSHRAVVVTEPALFSVSAADRALHAVENLRRSTAPDLQPLGVLVNRYRERSPEHRYRLAELGQMFGPLVLSPAIPERSALQQSQGASQPVHRWPGAAAQELSELFDAHLARIMRVASRGLRRR